MLPQQVLLLPRGYRVLLRRLLLRLPLLLLATTVLRRTTTTGPVAKTATTAPI